MLSSYSFSQKAIELTYKRLWLTRKLLGKHKLPPFLPPFRPALPSWQPWPTSRGAQVTIQFPQSRLSVFLFLPFSLAAHALRQTNGVDQFRDVDDNGTRSSGSMDRQPPSPRSHFVQCPPADRQYLLPSHSWEQLDHGPALCPLVQILSSTRYVHH